MLEYGQEEKEPGWKFLFFTENSGIIPLNLVADEFGFELEYAIVSSTNSSYLPNTLNCLTF